MHVMHRFYLMFVEIAPISVCTSRIVALVGPSIGVPGPSSEYCVRDLLFLRLK